MKSTKIKRCTYCGRFLSKDDFYLRKEGYRQSYCKKCQSNQGKLWHENNKEYAKQRCKQWYENNKDTKVKQYLEDNKKHISDRSYRYQKQYRKDNPNKVNYLNSKYRAAKLKANVPWANEKIITYIYKECVELNKLYPKVNEIPKFSVDHYYPLQSKFVCGLHHENNLHITTGKENWKKNNKFPEKDIYLNRTI